MKHHTTRWHLGNIPVVSGGDGPDDDETNNDEETDEEEESEPKAKEKTYSEARVQSMIKNRVKSAHRQAGEELAKELGYDSVSDMKAALENSKNKDSEEERDLAKERSKIEADKAETKRLRAEATQERLDLQVERALLAAGVKPSKAEKAVRLIDLRTADDPDADDINEAVEAFSEEWSELFDSEGREDDEERREPKSRVPGSDVGRQPPKKPKGSAADRAAARLAERHPELASKG